MGRGMSEKRLGSKKMELLRATGLIQWGDTDIVICQLGKLRLRR